LTKCIEDPEIFKLLDSIYYAFDLVNFNMNRNEFGIGAAFAKARLSGMRERLEKIEVKFDQIPSAPLLDTPTLDHMIERLKFLLKSAQERRRKSK